MLGKLIDAKSTPEYKELEEKYNKLTKDFINLKKESKDHIIKIDKLENENLQLKGAAAKDIGESKLLTTKKENDLEKSINILLRIVDQLIKTNKIIYGDKNEYIFFPSEDFRNVFSEVINSNKESEQNAYLRIYRTLGFLSTDKNRFNKNKLVNGNWIRVFAIDRKKLKLVIDLLGDD